MSMVILDGIRLQVLAADLDGDGITGEIETVQHRVDQGIIPVNQPTELGESLVNLNEDEVDPRTRMSGIDLRARIHPSVMPYFGAMDALVRFGVMPRRCSDFTRQMKRLTVSERGLGRQEIVDVVSGKQEQDARKAGGGFGERMKGLFGMGNN